MSQETSAFFASQGAASEAINRLVRAGFSDHDIEREPITGGSGVRVTVHAYGNRLQSAMRILDSDELLSRDEDDSHSWVGDWHMPRSADDLLQSNPLIAVGMAVLAGVVVGALVRRI